MNYSKLFLVLLACAASLVAAAAHPSGSGDNLPGRLSWDDFFDIGRMLKAEDNPHRVAEVLGDRQLVPDDRLRRLLLDTMHFGRPESFKALFDRVVLDRDDAWPMPILQRAADRRLFEICDHILGRDFRLGTLFSALTEPCSSVHEFCPDIAQLRELARRHPDRIAKMCPKIVYFLQIDDAPTILFLIDFIEYCRGESPAFAEHPKYEPSAILKALLQNWSISDREMAIVIDRLVQLGATLELKAWELFQKEKPGYVRAVHALNAALIVEEVKEPGCD